jgi:hypothetical protein
MQTNMQKLKDWGRTSSLPSSSPLSPLYSGNSPNNPFGSSWIQQPVKIPTMQPISIPASSIGSSFNRPGGIGSSYSGVSSLPRI